MSACGSRAWNVGTLLLFCSFNFVRGFAAGQSAAAGRVFTHGPYPVSASPLTEKPPLLPF